MKPFLLIILLALLLPACGKQDAHCAALPEGGRYCLQATALAPAFEVQQEVLVRYQDKSDTMIASVENDAQALDFVGLTPFGQKILHMRYDNQAATAILTPDQRIAPAMMLGLLQLALWPADAVRAGLDQSSILEESGQQRSISRHGHTIINIHYQNPAQPYQQLSITLPAGRLSLEIKRLPDVQLQDDNMPGEADE